MATRGLTPTLAAGLVVLSLCACQPMPMPGALDVVLPPGEGLSADISPTSRALQEHYGRVQQGYLARGLLRVDGGGPDATFTRRQLVDNFMRIAFFEEFTRVGNRIVSRQAESHLHRWEGPIRMQVHFGSSVSQEMRNRDRVFIARLARRLSALTGVPITLTSRRVNFHVFVVNEDERRAMGPVLRAIHSGIDASTVSKVLGIRRPTLCLVYATEGRAKGVYAKAVAVVRAEHPMLLRQSCYHEELAQGLGLPNDSPRVRPSIFNDDEEFAFLTVQDELLLRMLYDRRLRPGMMAAEGRPVVERIASELLGGEV
ncbi:MAG: DUF2927 domain-containing protein [Boseongicola sp. SB0677_bin_26]|nr:DUF2927 domain-containing protein [Boseongicola sp. SB0677_bin_26]